MQHDAIGKKLSTVDIFNNFQDLVVLGDVVWGDPDVPDEPETSLIIRYVGKPEEVDELRSKHDGHLAVHYGKNSRKGDSVIFNSDFPMQNISGVWNTSVTSDGTMSNERLVLHSDGTGFFAEANMSPYWETPITWYIEGGDLTICSDDRTLCHAPLQYEPDVIVPCMSREERHFSGLLNAAYGLNYYRDINANTLE